MWVCWLDLVSVLSEVVDVRSEDFHVLTGVFERLAFRLRDHLVLILGVVISSPGEGPACERALVRYRTRLGTSTESSAQSRRPTSRYGGFRCPRERCLRKVGG